MGLKLPFTAAKKHFLRSIFHILCAYLTLEGRINLNKVICYLHYACLTGLILRQSKKKYKSDLIFKISSVNWAVNLKEHPCPPHTFNLGIKQPHKERWICIIKSEFCWNVREFKEKSKLSQKEEADGAF